MATNLFAKGADYLKDRRTENLTEDITYLPKAGGGSLAVKATLGVQNFEEEKGGLIIEVISKDFIINADAIPEPQEGDRITYSTKTYEVQPMGGAKAWLWSDSFNSVYRVHTKEIKTP